MTVAYWNLPSQVVWVDTPRRRLQGFDNYWVDGDRYGVFNDPENVGTMYEGRQAIAWQLTPEGEIEVDPTPPPGAEILRGFMLTDEQARLVGLI